MIYFHARLRHIHLHGKNCTMNFGFDEDQWFYGINNNLQQYILLVSCSNMFILFFNSRMMAPLQQFFIHFIKFKQNNKIGPISFNMHYVSWFLIHHAIHNPNQQFKLRENEFLQKLTFFATTMENCSFYNYCCNSLFLFQLCVPEEILAQIFQDIGVEIKNYELLGFLRIW